MTAEAPVIAAALVRVSLDRTRHFGQQEALISPDTQRDRCRHFCLARGWALPDAHLFEEIDVSGRLVPLERRPALQHVFRLAETGAIQRLVVYMFSRLSRRLADTLAVVERLQACGCHLVSVSEPVDTATEFGRMFLSILQAINQYAAEVTARQVSETWLTLARSGRRPPGKPPYGFELERGIPRPRPDEYPHLLTAHRVVAATGSVSAAVRALEAAGARPRHAARWHPNTVRGWLANPFYDGRVALNGRTYPADWAPPVPPALRAAARRARAATPLPDRDAGGDGGGAAAGGAGPAQRPADAGARAGLPLAGRVWCLGCGGRYRKYSRRDGTLSCGRPGCGAPHVAVAELQAAVAAQLRQLWANPAVQRTLAAVAASNSGAADAVGTVERARRRAALQRRRRRLQQALQALVDDHYLEDRLGRDAFAAAADRYRKELAALEGQLAALARPSAGRGACPGPGPGPCPGAGPCSHPGGDAGRGAAGLPDWLRTVGDRWPDLDARAQRRVLEALDAAVAVDGRGAWLTLSGAVRVRLPGCRVWRRLHFAAARRRLDYRASCGRWTDRQERFLARTWGRWSAAAIAARLGRPLRAVRARAAAVLPLRAPQAPLPLRAPQAVQ